MRWIIALAFVGSTALAGCGPSICEKLNTAVEDFNNNVKACNDAADAGSTRIAEIIPFTPLSSSEINACNSACADSTDTKDIDDYTACLDALGTCDPSDAGAAIAWEDAFIACGKTWTVGTLACANDAPRE